MGHAYLRRVDEALRMRIEETAAAFEEHERTRPAAARAAAERTLTAKEDRDRAGEAVAKAL